MTIDPKFAKSVTTQEYTKKNSIEGVELINYPIFADDGGHFTELIRLDDSGFAQSTATPFAVKQMSMSYIYNGAIKAFHLHYKQDDLWFVPPSDTLLVNLHDLRVDSPTYDQHMRLTLGMGKPILLRIPAGVAHGAGNLYGRPMILFYATSNQFNAAEPDEHRLPWDTFGAQVWELTKG